MKEKKLVASVEDAKEKVYELHRYLLDHPETSGEEVETSKRIVALLREEGMETEEGFAGMPTAFRARVADGKRAERVAILCEFDALPGIGHACGHSASAAISVLAAIGLHRNQDLFDCGVDLIGTPDEEVHGGKIEMVEKGVFDEYAFAMMIHMDTANKIDMKFKALSNYVFTFHGTPAHASSNPWEGRSALNGVMLMIHAFDMMRQTLKPDTRIHGIITEGGEADNVIPDKAVAEYAFRSDDIEELKKIVEWAMDAAKGAALATQTRVEIRKRNRTYFNMKNNAVLNEFAREAFKDLGLEENPSRQESLGSSDAGNVSHVCPAVHPCIAVGDVFVPHHTREFEQLMRTPEAQEAIQKGAIAIATTVLRVDGAPDGFDRIAEEFTKDA
jgi:amidohydrolase